MRIKAASLKGGSSLFSVVTTFLSSPPSSSHRSTSALAHDKKEFSQPALLPHLCLISHCLPCATMCCWLIINLMEPHDYRRGEDGFHWATLFAVAHSVQTHKSRCSQQRPRSHCSDAPHLSSTRKVFELRRSGILLSQSTPVSDYAALMREFASTIPGT